MHNDEGIQSYRQGQWEAAKEHFEDAIMADPDLAEPHYNLALTPPRSCCKTSSEKTRTLAAWCMASQVFRSVPRSSWKSSWKCSPDPTGEEELS